MSAAGMAMLCSRLFPFESGMTGPLATLYCHNYTPASTRHQLCWQAGGAGQEITTALSNIHLWKLRMGFRLSRWAHSTLSAG